MSSPEQTEAAVREYRKKIDEMKGLILKYGVLPTMLYASEKGRHEITIWTMAYSELRTEGKIT